MKNKKEVPTLLGAIIIIISSAILFGGIFAYQYFFMPSVQDIIKIPEAQTAGWKTYLNNDYGFSIIFPDSWKGYSVVEKKWQGHVINNYQKTYSGPEIIIKNPQTTQTQQWQDIPIMVFTPAVWKMVNGANPTVEVSAAPIGPAKIGENAKYVFATPPRWYGFTDAVGFQEAVEIVKTFKAF